MASKGNDRHMKRLASPRFVGAHRKESAYMMKVRPGRHSLSRSMPIAQFVKSVGMAGSTGSAKAIIGRGELQVNGRRVRDFRYPIGLNDLVTFRKGDHYKIGINRQARATFQKVEQTKVFTYKLIRKYKTRNGVIMFGLSDGSMVRGSNDGRVNDSVELSEGKVKGILKLEKGAGCLIIDGVHVGVTGKVKDIKEGTMHSQKGVTVESEGTTFQTIVDNVMITR